MASNSSRALGERCSRVSATELHNRERLSRKDEDRDAGVDEKATFDRVHGG